MMRNIAILSAVLLLTLPVAGLREPGRSSHAAADEVAPRETEPAPNPSASSKKIATLPNTPAEKLKRAAGDSTARTVPATTIVGRVFDHEGKPVAGAGVFLRGPGAFSMENGEFDFRMGRKRPQGVATDNEGRFHLEGLGIETHVVVVPRRLCIWAVPTPERESKGELTIRLPKPATLKVVMDIPGAIQGNEKRTQNWHTAPAGNDPWLRLQLETWNMEGWKGVGDFTQTRSVANPGEMVFENLTPGSYDFCWHKTYFLGDRGTGAYCDRQLGLQLAPGETKTLRLVRNRGQRLSGTIHGLPNDVPGAWIYVRPITYTGDPEKRDEWKLPTFDCLTCRNDAVFLTALLEPGQYKIIVQAYRPEPKDQPFRTGVRRPDFTATAVVTVEDADPTDVTKPAPFVTIEMTPRNDKPTPGKASADDWGPERQGLRTRLVAQQSVYTIGLPAMFSVELKNVSNKEQMYDAQQVGVNDSLQVLDPKGRQVRYVYGGFQTSGSGHTLGSGQTVTLGKIDVGEQYLLVDPGVYTLQFRESPYGNIPPSNAIHIKWQAGVVGTTRRVMARLNDVLPKDWTMLEERWWLNPAVPRGQITPFGWQPGQGVYLHLLGVGAWSKEDGWGVQVWVAERRLARAEEKAASQSTKPPPAAEYLGQGAEGHVYCDIPKQAEAQWPNIRAKIAAALGAGR
jgi:hypothetical protein